MAKAQKAKPAQRAALKATPKPSRSSARKVKHKKPAPNPSHVCKKVSSLPKPPWECDVDVYLRPPGSDPAFELQTSLEMNSANRIFFRNRRRPGFVIRFRLNNDLNPGYHFPADPLQGCWSEAGSLCPSAQVWDVFSPYAVEDNGMTLVVYNENPRPSIGNFQFCLNVIHGGGKPPLWLDPGGADQNGARS